MINLSDAESHIGMLHSLSEGLDGVMVLASFGETKGGMKLAPCVEHFRIGDVTGMTQRAMQLSQQPSRNVYMPLAVMRPDLPSNSKGTEKDVIAILGFVADFDKGLGNEHLERCPFKASYVLKTYPGNAQCFFLFEKPMVISGESDRARAKDYVERLTQAAKGADPTGADLSHVWRIPGLYNWPNIKKLKEGRSENPFTVEIEKAFDSTFTPLSELEKLSPAEKKTEQKGSQSIELEHRKKVSAQELSVQGDTVLASLIESKTPEGERSEAVASVVWKLLSLGYGTGDIAEVIYKNPQGIGERYKGDKGRIEDDVLRLASKKEGADKSSEPEKPKHPYTLQTLGAVNEISIPPRSWVLGRHLLKGKVTVLIAPPGVGKSTASLTWAMSIATGKNLFDLPVHESGAVAVINNEDDMDEMHRRIAAVQKFHKIQKSELDGKFFLQSGEEQQLIIAKRNPQSKAIYPYHKDDLIEFCVENKIKALFVDPFLETHEADENDNRQISEVARMYREVAQKADCAVCLIHHTRKQQGQSSAGHAGNMDSGRGASSLIGVARIVCTLYDMSESDAKHYGVSEDDRYLYLRLDDAKANLSLKSHQACWYRRETVQLMNGDSVGVLRVAYDIQNALAANKSTLAGMLISKVKSHEAFKVLRENGKMKREAFISAMIDAGAYLGKKTDKRSTLQDQTEKRLLGKGITDGGVRVYMEKRGSLYTVYADFDGLPEDAGKNPASLKQNEFSAVLPEAAEIYRQLSHKGLENNNAGLPPL